MICSCSKKTQSRAKNLAASHQGHILMSNRWFLTNDVSRYVNNQQFKHENKRPLAFSALLCLCRVATGYPSRSSCERCSWSCAMTATREQNYKTFYELVWECCHLSCLSYFHSVLKIKTSFCCVGFGIELVEFNNITLRHWTNRSFFIELHHKADNLLYLSITSAATPMGK